MNRVRILVLLLSLFTATFFLNGCMMMLMHGSEHSQQTEKAPGKQSSVAEKEQESERPAVTHEEKPAEYAHDSRSKPLMFLGVAAMAAMMLLMLL